MVARCDRRCRQVIRPQDEQFEYDGNIIGKTWAKLRSGYGTIVNSLGEFEMWSSLHWSWMGDLSDKKVLDLGCHAGNQLSLDLAKKSKYYVGLDLSESATAELQKKINDAGIENAITIAADFLSEDFTERDFDVVYAQSVFHHFKYKETKVFVDQFNGLLNSFLLISFA